METETSNTHAPTPAASVPPGIDVSKLEKELNASWEEAATQDGGTVRVCVLNLIVYATATDDHRKIDEMLSEVTAQNPCRAIILYADREASEAKLNADAAVCCVIGAAGARHVCGERVTIEAGGASLRAISTAIEPLLVSDVPVFLFWQDIPHYEDTLFNRLVDMSDRVVIDSLKFDHPREDLLRLAEIIREHPKFMLVSDVNWGRLTSWRTLLASFWDVPDYHAHLDKLVRVVAEYDPPSIAPDNIAAQALLVTGWLAACFGWQAEANKTQNAGNGVPSPFVLHTHDGRTVQVEMRASGEPKTDGRLTALTLLAEDGAAEFFVAFNRENGTIETSAKIGEARTVGRVVGYEGKTESTRLSRELSILSRDAIYESAVQAAAEMIR